MPEQPFHPRRPHLVRPVPVDPDGIKGPTRGLARGPAYRRTGHGLYVPATVSDDLVEQRIVEAVPRSREVAVSGWAALRWAGGRWFDGLGADGSRRPVPLVASTSVRGSSGTTLRKEGWRGPEDHAVLDGLRVTSPTWSLSLEVRHARSLVAAVVAIDMAAYDDLVSIDELSAFTATHGPRTGVGQAREACLLADENSWSPRESWMRLVWMVDAGLPRPLCNQPVFDRSGRHIGTPDLLDPVAGVAGDYDGAIHLDPERRRADRDRGEGFRSVGLEYLTVMAGDGRSGQTVRRMRAAHARAGARPAEDRAWTIEPPPWWRSATTVSARRALDDSDRDRLLRYRRTG